MVSESDIQFTCQLQRWMTTFLLFGWSCGIKAKAIRCQQRLKVQAKKLDCETGHKKPIRIKSPDRVDPTTIIKTKDDEHGQYVTKMVCVPTAVT